MSSGFQNWLMQKKSFWKLAGSVFCSWDDFIFFTDMETDWTVTCYLLIKNLPECLYIPFLTPDHSCIKSCWGWSSFSVSSYECMYVCVVDTLTNAALGFIVVKIAGVTQTVIATLLILTPCCSTHTWIFTLIDICKMDQSVLNNQLCQWFIIS